MFMDILVSCKSCTKQNEITCSSSESTKTLKCSSSSSENNETKILKQGWLRFKSKTRSKKYALLTENSLLIFKTNSCELLKQKILLDKSTLYKATILPQNSQHSSSDATYYCFFLHSGRYNKNYNMIVILLAHTIHKKLMR